MKKKVTTYEEVKISDEVRKKCIDYLKDNPQTVYWDRNDKLSLEQVDKLMKSQEDYYELENDLWESNIDYICELEDNLLKEMRDNFPELEDIEISDLRDGFCDYLSVGLNIEQLVKTTPDVRVRVVIHSNYEGVNYADRGTGDFKDSDYIREVRKLLKENIDEKSFQDELDNIMSCVNQFIFYFKTDVQSLIGINEGFKKSITIPKGAWAGFYDSWNGSGSVLEVKLLEDITLKKQYGKTKYDCVDIVLDEAHKYSVEETYGLCNVPEVTLKVK
jgi:hypothetical protein